MNVFTKGAVFPMDSQIPQNQTGDTSRNPNRVGSIAISACFPTHAANHFLSFLS
jgi:hypothetical protein